MNVCVIDCSNQTVTVRPATKRELAQAARDAKENAARNLRGAYLELRQQRDALLRLTDHFAGEPGWDRWRQKLRDLPATVDPEKPRWPKPPAAVSCLHDFRGLWPRLDWTHLTEGTH